MTRREEGRGGGGEDKNCTDLIRLTNLHNFKLIHVIIRPAERNLQHLMKVIEGIARRNREETGDCRVGSAAEAGEKEVVFWGRSLCGLSVIWSILEEDSEGGTCWSTRSCG